MLELKISDADILSDAVKPFIEIADEGIAIYAPDGILLVALDQEELVHVILSIESFESDNDFFRCDHIGFTVVDFVELRNRLELEHDEDSITIRADAEEDRFHILFHKVGLNQFRHLEMELIQVTEEHLPLINFQLYDHNVSLGIPSEDFHEIFWDWVLNGVPVSVAVTYAQVEFSAGDENFVIPKGESEQGECIIEGVGEEDQVEVETTLVTVNKFIDAALLSNRVWLNLTQGVPAMLNFPVADIGDIMFYFNEQVPM